MLDSKAELFAVFAEVDGYERPLILTGLTFGRLIDEVILPNEEDKPFFVDGALVDKKKIRRLKILRQKEAFQTAFFDLHHGMRRKDEKIQKLYGEQYHVRLEAALREGCEDVTSQVIKAYAVKVKPNIKKYLPNRSEIIEGAWTFFMEALKKLGGL
jgi:hypothetical protein